MERPGNGGDRYDGLGWGVGNRGGLMNCRALGGGAVR